MKEILEDIKHIKTRDRDIRFLFLILAAIGSFIIYKFVPTYERFDYLFAIYVFFCIGLLFPKPFTGLYKIWMAGSICLGLVMSTILFTLVYVIGFIPIGFWLKTSNQQPMDLSFKSPRESYLNKKKKVAQSSLEKQY